MQHLLQFGLSNAMAAAVLAVLATVATRVWRNPHFAYALWLVVLLRLVAPPLLPVGLPMPQWMAVSFREPLPVVSASEKEALPSIDGVEFVAVAEFNRAKDTGGPKLPPVAPEPDRPRLSSRATAVRTSALVAQTPVLEDRGKPEVAPPGRSSSVTQFVASRWPAIAKLLANVWLTGTLCYLLLTAFRVRRFARVLRRARRDVPAGVAAEAAEVAAAVGLRRVPRLAFAEAALPPMVWPDWRPVVLLPEALFTSLGAGERRLLLCHEFLHLRRRDHLVRWFEVGIVALYWWNPVAWWAVARLQQAEEDCCDAAVLAAHPHDSARYGETLVSVAQFLSTGTLPTPALSVGVARNAYIKRRLTMILHGPRWPELSRGRFAAFSLLGAALVAVTWTAANGQVAPTAPAASSEAPSSAAVEERWHNPAPVLEIQEILVEGNSTIPTADILKKVKTQAGRDVTPSQVQEDIRTLINTRWFFSVVPKYRRTGKKLILVLAVVERPTVRSVEYQGAKEIPLNKLAVETGLKVGSPYSNGANQDAARHLENFYHQQGYTEATVELIKGDKPDDYDVVLRIHEGVKQKVVGRYFVGNQSVSDEKLATELQSSPASLIHGDKFDPINTTDDVHVLRKYYAELGFFDATVKPTVHYSKDRKSISLEYAVHEGVHYKVRKFSITSNVPFKADELLRISKTHEGQFCDGFQIREELQKFKEESVASGFTPLNVEIHPLFPPEQPGLVDIAVRVSHENKKGASLPSAPAQASNGDTKKTAASSSSQAAAVPNTRSIPFVKMEPMPPAPGDDELRKLQKERYNAALGQFKLYNELGTPGNGERCKAMRNLYDAWKVFAKSSAEELQAVDWYVDYTNRRWNLAYSQLLEGRPTDSLRIDEAETRAARLEAQIESMKLRQALTSKTGASGALEPERAKAVTESSAARPNLRRATKRYEREELVAQPPAGDGLFPPNLMPMDIAATDDEERKLHKEQYNAAAEEMDIYRKEWQSGNLDLAGQIENVLAAAGKMRDAELSLGPDAKARLATLGKYLDLTRNLEQIALGWVKHGGIAGVNAPRAAVRMHEARLEAELQIARIRRELAQNEQQQNQPPSLPPQTPRTALPRLLPKGPIAVDPNDDELRVKLLNEQYNALQSLKVVNKSREPGAALTVSEFLKTARQMLAAQVALARPRDLVWVYEGYVDVMKYFESLPPTLPPDSNLPTPEVFRVDGFREARLEAEQKLAEARQQEAFQKREKSGGPSLPRLLNVGPIGFSQSENVSERMQFLAKQYTHANSTLESLWNTGQVPRPTANDLLAAARQLRVTHDELGRPQGSVDFYEQYVELMKTFESLAHRPPSETEPRLPPGYRPEPFRVERLVAEQKLAEAQQKLDAAQQTASPPRNGFEKKAAKAPLPAGPSGVVPVPPLGPEQRPVGILEKPPLPKLLTSPPLEVTPQDDARTKSLKERRNAALKSLPAVPFSAQTDVPAAVKALITNARQLLDAEIALAGPDEVPPAYERSIELMKYFESIESPNTDGSVDVDHFLAIRDARREAEQKLAELKRNSAHQKQTTHAGGAAPVAAPQPVPPPPATVPLPALLASKPLEPAAGDDVRERLLKERYNAALRLLQASYALYKVVPVATVTKVISAARRLLAADLAQASDPVAVRQRYLELMKYVERMADARAIGTEEMEAAHEARLDAELDLLDQTPVKVEHRLPN
jgi:beta-lactamase regulating signal transducer with metallopeptidase domain